MQNGVRNSKGFLSPLPGFEENSAFSFAVGRIMEQVPTIAGSPKHDEETLVSETF